MTNELSRLLLKYKEHRIDSSNSFTNTGFREIQTELKLSFADQYEINKFEIKKMREKLKQINNEILGFKKFLSSESDVHWCISEGKLYLKDISKLDVLKKKASSSNYPGLLWNSIRRYLAGGCHYIYLHSTQFFIDNKKDDTDNDVSLIDLFDDPSLNKAFSSAPLDQILASIFELVQNDDFNIDNDDIVSENIGIYDNNSSSPSSPTSAFTSDLKSANGSSTKVKRNKHHHSPSSSPTSKKQKKQIDDLINHTDNDSPAQPHQYHPNYYIHNSSNIQFDTFSSNTNVKKPSANIQNLVHNNSNSSQQLLNVPFSSSQSHNSGQQVTERNAIPSGVGKKSSFSMLAAVLNKPLTSNSGAIPTSNILSNTSNSRSSSTSSTTSSSGSMNGAQNNKSGSSSSTARLGTTASSSANIVLNGVGGSTAAGPPTTTSSNVPGSVNMNIVSPFNPGNIPNLYDPFSTRSQRGSLNVQSQPQQQSTSSSANSHLQQRNSLATTSSRRSLTFLDSLWNFHGSGSGSASGGTGMGSNGSFFLPNPNHLYTGSPNLAITTGSFSGVGGSLITSNPLNIASPPLNATSIDNNNSSSNKDSIISNSGSSSSDTPRNSTTSRTQQHDTAITSTSSTVPANASNNGNGTISGASSRRSNSNPDLFLLPDPVPSSTTSSPHPHNHHHMLHHLVSSNSSSANNSHSSNKPILASGRPVTAVVTASAIDLKRASSPSILPPLASTSLKVSSTSNIDNAKSETVDFSSLNKTNSQKQGSNSRSDHPKCGNPSSAENTSPSSHTSSLNLQSTNEASNNLATSNSPSTSSINANLTKKPSSSYAVNTHDEHDDVTVAASTLNDISAASRTPSFTGSSDERPDAINNTTKSLNNSNNNNNSVPTTIAHSLGNTSGPINTFNGVPLEFISPFSSNVTNANSNSSTNSTSGAIATLHHLDYRNHHNGVMEMQTSSSKTPVSPTAEHKDNNNATQTNRIDGETNSLLAVLFDRRKNIEEANDYLRKLRSLGIINSKTFIELGEIISTNDSLLFYIINKEIVFEEKVNFIKDLVLNQ